MACKRRRPSNTFGFITLREAIETDLSDLPDVDFCPVVITLNAPSNLQASLISVSEIDLDWVLSTTLAATSQTIQIAYTPSFTTGVTTITGIGAGVINYSATGLFSNTTYYFRVRAVFDVEGVDGAWSNIASRRTSDSGILNEDGTSMETEDGFGFTLEG